MLIRRDEQAVVQEHPTLKHPWSSKVNHLFIIAALWPALNLSDQREGGRVKV